MEVIFLEKQIKVHWNGKELWSGLIAKELELDAKNIIIKEHLFNSYVTAFTSNGEYKVEFDFNYDVGTYIKSIVKIK